MFFFFGKIEVLQVNQNFIKTFFYQIHKTQRIKLL